MTSLSYKFATRSLRRLCLAAGLTFFVLPAHAQTANFKQSLATAAAANPELTHFYKQRDFEGLWTGPEGAARRNALMRAYSTAADHGLPAQRFNAETLRERLQSAGTEAEKGALEAEMTQGLLAYARALQSGVVDPAAIGGGIHRAANRRSDLDILNGFTASDAASFLRELPPQSAEYRNLMREKLRLERLIAEGGWGNNLAEAKLEPGDRGARVVALRDRLIAMGYLQPTFSPDYDAHLRRAVELAQQDAGLSVDGVAGPMTIRALNKSPEKQLRSVIVAMERERWMNPDLGERHIWVNLADFTAVVVDDDIPTFVTRSVIGSNETGRRSPEFSDEMEYMVINPNWYVPRSIVVKEYLPRLKANPNAVSHIDITNSSGRTIPRSAINFSQYSASSFPYSMRQPPSSRNALGLVKFIFPNPYNIYLHDTPSQSLFQRSVRAFSHGCIRLDDPFDLAYVLLAPQVDNPRGFFHSKLDTGREQYVYLDKPVPVHIVYRTAFAHTDGSIRYRPDIYGRDARIWGALRDRGVGSNSAG